MAEVMECPHCNARFFTADGVCPNCRSTIKDSEAAKLNKTQLAAGAIAERDKNERRAGPKRLILMGSVLVIGGVLFGVIWGAMPAVFWLPMWILATLAFGLGAISLLAGLALFVSDRF